MLLFAVVFQAVRGSRGIPPSCSFPVCCRGTSPPPADDSTSGPASRDNRVDVSSTCSDDVNRWWSMPQGPVAARWRQCWSRRRGGRGLARRRRLAADRATAPVVGATNRLSSGWDRG